MEKSDEILDMSKSLEKTNFQMQTMFGNMDKLSNQIDRINNIFDKQRQHTQDEIKVLQDYKEKVKEVADTMKDAFPGRFKGMNDYSVALVAIEDKMKSLMVTSENAKKKLADINKVISDTTQQKSGAEGAIQEAEDRLKKYAEREEKMKKLQGLAGGRGTRENANLIQQELGIDEKLHPMRAKKLARVAALDFKDANSKDNPDDLQKIIGASRSVLDSENKKLAVLEKERKILSEIRRESETQLKTTQKDLEAHNDLYKTGKRRFDDEQRVRARTNRSNLLGGAMEVGSDLNLPGLSTVNTVAKYGRRGADMFTPKNEEGEAIGGMAGMMGGAAGLGVGLLAGTGIAAAGYGVYRGYKGYNKAQQMAPERVRLAGLVGNRGLDQTRALQTDRGMEQLGYSADENLPAMGQVARSLGSKQIGQLTSISQTSRQFGLDRGETTGMAGALMEAGGANPKNAAESLKAVMIEGVQSGIDRARITQFTQQVVGIQEEQLRISGTNKTKDIAASLGDLFKFSKSKDVGQFMKGPEMGAVRSIDQAMKGAARGGGGMASGTLFRAFGHDDLKSGKDYVSAIKDMEGGIFGGSGKKGDTSTDRLQKVFGQYNKETGGNKDLRSLRMQQEMGIGINQSEKLGSLLERKQSGKISASEQKDLDKGMKELQESMKDPMVRMAEQTARSANLLAKLADGALPEFTAISTGINNIDEKFDTTISESIAKIGEMLGIRTGKKDTDVAVERAGRTGMSMGTGMPTSENAFGDFFGAIKSMITGEKMGESGSSDAAQSYYQKQAGATPDSGNKTVTEKWGDDLSGLIKAFSNHGEKLEKNTMATKENTMATKPTGAPINPNARSARVGGR